MTQYVKFLKLFFHKAYVWHYLESNGELEEFYEARETMRVLLDSYEELLQRAIETEGPKSKLRVFGATEAVEEKRAGAGHGRSDRYHGNG